MYKFSILQNEIFKFKKKDKIPLLLLYKSHLENFTKQFGHPYI